MTCAVFAQLERFLAGLDRQHSYYSVSHVAGLIREERLDIPCDLKLTLFVGEGDQDVDQAPHMNVVPIPLLGLVRFLRRDLSADPACARCLCALVLERYKAPHMAIVPVLLLGLMRSFHHEEMERAHIGGHAHVSTDCRV